TDDVHAIGAGLLASGIGGLIIGNSVAKKYDYSQGDTDVISTLTLIGTGLGLAVAVESINSNDNTGIFLLPAVTAIAGTMLGQKSVKGIHFTKSQGNIISFATGGAALVGIGLMVVTEAESGLLVIGVPSVFALIAHQAMFNSYKKENLSEIKLGKSANKRVQFSMNVAPENYFANKRAGEKIVLTGQLASPLVKLKLRF
ncbi:MAG TPA: hypothetical protein PKC10_09395, partial [Cyclobacteriaceae bacterium]|nr:hypothetical protein [Cyclobacteriaceae bacterium]